MPSQRQYRSVIIIVIIVITFVIYVTRGPSMTHDSDFYKRTVSHMKEQSRHAAAIQHAEEHAKRRSNGDHMHVAEQQHIQEHGERPAEQIPSPMNDKLKARLREAEQLAKKSADEKYRALKDTEQEVSREKAERELKGKSIAGRKVVPPAAAAKGQQMLGANAEGHGQGHKHADNPGLQALYAELTSHSPITIFSKSFCPHSRKAKRILLHAFDITPKPYIVELDLHPHGEQLQALLNEMTGRRTVPNVMVGGTSVGGGDEIESLWHNGDMAVRLTELAGKTISKVSQVTKYGEDASFKL